MAKHTLKILRCSHSKIFKVCLAIYNIMHERVKKITIVQHLKSKISVTNEFYEHVTSFGFAVMSKK